MPTLRTAIERHPRVWGFALAVLLLVGYVTMLRPARLWTATHVVLPVLQQVRTDRADQVRLVQIARRPDAVFAIPRGVHPSNDDAYIRAEEPPQWAAPVGVIFLLPALFLIGLFPARPYWAYLLAYHVVLGVVALGVFAIGLGWWAPAFKAYTFARTYMAETVSLVVPLLLALAGGLGGGSRRSPSSADSAPPAPTAGTPAA